ncbi:MAG: glycosyltransferase family 2 protein [Cytophagales bacterium]|nr:MAG: glycosyltransferase family 2 protein [Cytophagales bacterium]
MPSIPVVSIVTPVWNGLPYLKECVESVLSQEFQEWEMIISDDGSNDGSRAYLDSLTDPRIKVYKQETNKGIFGNLNFIFSKVSAPISQFLFQDDYFISPTSLSTIVEYWKNSPPEVGFARFNHSGPSPCLTIALEKKITPEILSTKKAPVWFFVFGCVASNMSNVTLRTNMVEKLGGFREDLPYAGDFEFWTRASRQFCMGFQKEKITYVRDHSGQASAHLNRKGELVKQVEQVVNELYSNLALQHPKWKGILKLQGTLNYDSLLRDVAIRNWLLKGDKNYLNQLNRVNKTSAYTFGQPFLWLIYLSSLGGRLVRDVLAKFIVTKITDK